MNASVKPKLSEATSQLHAPIKLVIWDLDETFWVGTLSEGSVEPIVANCDLVRLLNRRGIVSSICSKNDLAAAKAQLEVDDDWEQFVFASIDWNPKGPRIASMIEAMGLRAVNVLFVDDNIMNLKEAEHYAPGIQTVEPDALLQLIDSPQLAGKDDKYLTRLAQYRVLETKVHDKLSTGASNEEFLRSSDIRVGLHEDSIDHIDRLIELVNRSNQLNYTKTRFDRDQFEELLSDKAVVSGYVTVRDKYGDYGICGFFAHDHAKVINLSFSCRILNMGVERWVYRHIGELPIDVVGEVATSLDELGGIDWIALDDGELGNRAVPSQRATVAENRRVLLKGGCDLSVLAEHFGGGIESEFTFSSLTGALVHQEHTEILKRANVENLRKYGDVIDRIPFLERSAYQSAIVDSPHSFDAIVYSVLMDYTQGVYRYRDTDFLVPFGEFSRNVTEPSNQSRYIDRRGKLGFDSKFFDWFSENFTFEGGLTPEMIGDNVVWLRRAIPASVQLILINGAEVPSPSPMEAERHLHHAACNRVLEDVVHQLENTEICDVRSAVSRPEDLTNNIRHYSRRAYFDLATQLDSKLSVPTVRRRSRLAIVAQQVNVDARRFVLRTGGSLLRQVRRFTE